MKIVLFNYSNFNSNLPGKGISLATVHLPDDDYRDFDYLSPEEDRLQKECSVANLIDIRFYLNVFAYLLAGITQPSSFIR